MICRMNTALYRLDKSITPLFQEGETQTDANCKVSFWNQITILAFNHNNDNWIISGLDSEEFWIECLYETYYETAEPPFSKISVPKSCTEKGEEISIMSRRSGHHI